MGFLKFLKEQEESSKKTVQGPTPNRGNIPPALPSGIRQRNEWEKTTKAPTESGQLPPLPPLERVQRIPDRFSEESLASQLDFPSEIDNPFETPPSRAAQRKEVLDDIPLLSKGAKELKQLSFPKNPAEKDSELSLPEFPDVSKLKELDEDELAQLFSPHKKEFEELETRARESQQHELARLHDKADIRTRREPLFVNVSGFKAVLGDLDSIRNQLQSGVAALDKIIEIKNSEDQEFTRWQKALEDVERKLMYIDKVVFETKHY